MCVCVCGVFCLFVLVAGHTLQYHLHESYVNVIVCAGTRCVCACVRACMRVCDHGTRITDNRIENDFKGLHPKPIVQCILDSR